MIRGRIAPLVAAMLLLGEAPASAEPSVSALAALASSRPLAELSAARGIVQVAREGAEVWLRAIPPLALVPGDRVRVLAGKAQLRFDDGSVVVLRNRTSLEIVDLAANKAGARTVTMRLTRGLMRAIVNRLHPADTFQVSSQNAVAAVKGTDFVFDGRQVTVLSVPEAGVRHQVQLSGVDGVRSVVVSEQMSASLRADGSVEAPRAADPSRMAELRLELEPANLPGPPPGVTPAVPGGGNDHAVSDQAATPVDPAAAMGSADVERAVEQAIITGDQAPTPAPAPVEDTCGCGCAGATAKCK